jgi:hypothetical protein
MNAPYYVGIPPEGFTEVAPFQQQGSSPAQGVDQLTLTFLNLTLLVKQSYNSDILYPQLSSPN